jgi:hypothetical protein
MKTVWEGCNLLDSTRSPANLIVDVGSGDGSFTLRAIDRDETTFVLAYESDEAAAHTLAQQIQALGATNRVFVTVGEISPSNLESGFAALSQFSQVTFRDFRVSQRPGPPRRSFDEVPVDMIRIAQGNRGAIIRTLARLLSSRHPRVLVECHSSESCMEAQDALECLGYWKRMDNGVRSERPPAVPLSSEKASHSSHTFVA